MSDHGDDRHSGPGDAFRKLKDRPTPELDSEHLWRRVETELTPRRQGFWQQLAAGLGKPRAPGKRAVLVPRFAYAGAGLAFLAVTVWLGSGLLQTAPEGRVATDPALAVPQPLEQQMGAQLVLLNPDEPAAAGDPEQTNPEATVDADRSEQRMMLYVRLVRGYDGAPPLDVTAAAALGVGGADVLTDVRPQVSVLLPYDEFGLLAQGRGGVGENDDLRIELAHSYRFTAAAAEIIAGGTPIVSLREVRLSGAGEELMAADLNLEIGRNYILGVQPAEGPGSLLVVVRAELVPADEEQR